MKPTCTLLPALLLATFSAVHADDASDQKRRIEARRAKYLEWMVENFGELTPEFCQPFDMLAGMATVGGTKNGCWMADQQPSSRRASPVGLEEGQQSSGKTTLPLNHCAAPGAQDLDPEQLAAQLRDLGRSELEQLLLVG